MKFITPNSNEVDKGTYGNSKCAIDLAKILTDINNKGITGKVGKILHNFNCGMDDLSNTKKMTESFYKIWYIRYKTAILNKRFPKDVETRVLNLITGKYRNELNKLKDE